MIIDLTQTKIERQMQPLTNEQKEEIIAQLLSTEEGRQQLIGATEPRRCPKLLTGNADQYICRHNPIDGLFDPSGDAWRTFLCGFGAGLCNNYEGDFSEQSLEWTKGYKKGKKARHKAFDEMTDECDAACLVDGARSQPQGER